jgi:hypothetical protein
VAPAFWKRASHEQLLVTSRPDKSRPKTDRDKVRTAN